MSAAATTLNTPWFHLRLPGLARDFAGSGKFYHHAQSRKYRRRYSWFWSLWPMRRMHVETTLAL